MLQAVLWLTTNNPYFKDVEIHREAINCLPENGIPNGLRFVLDTKVSPHEDEDEGPPQEHAVDNDNSVEEYVLGGERTSFIPQRQRQRKDQDAIRETVKMLSMNLEQMVLQRWHFLHCSHLGKVTQPHGQDNMV